VQFQRNRSHHVYDITPLKTRKLCVGEFGGGFVAPKIQITAARPHYDYSLILKSVLIAAALFVGSCERNGDPHATLETDPSNAEPATNNAPPPADDAPFVNTNAAPVADAGIDAAVNGGAWLGLDGSQSVAGGTSPVHYAWRQTGGLKVALQNADAPTSGFFAPAVAYDERLEFELTVANDTSTTSSDRVAVTIVAKKSIYVVVDQATLTDLAADLETFRADVQASTSNDTRVVVAPSSPAALRDLLRGGYEQEGLRGAFLIGAVPIVYLQNAQDSSIVNLSDSFYRALYCPVDSTADANRYVMESTASININCLPNIWVSRIKSTRPDDTLTQIKQYLDKNHRTRGQPDRWQPTMSFVAGMAIDDTTDYAKGHRTCVHKPSVVYGGISNAVTAGFGYRTESGASGGAGHQHRNLEGQFSRRADLYLVSGKEFRRLHRFVPAAIAGAATEVYRVGKLQHRRVRHGSLFCR